MPKRIEGHERRSLIQWWCTTLVPVGNVDEPAAQPGLAADGALRRQDRADFESRNQPTALPIYKAPPLKPKPLGGPSKPTLDKSRTICYADTRLLLPISPAVIRRPVMSSPFVRRACTDDLDQLCRLYVAFHEFHVQGVPDRLISLGLPEYFDCTDLIANLQRLFDQVDAALFVAIDADQVIGLAEVYLRQDGDNGATVGYRYGYLQSLLVQEAFRHRHIGARLVEAAQQWAAQQGATEMHVDVWEFASGPLPFYERLGYRTLRRTLVRPLDRGSSGV